MKNIIDWNTFRVNHSNPNKAFEDLCIEILRLKLNYNGEIESYKNQWGLETEPINGIGIQVKFVENNNNLWNQIEKSTNTILKGLENKEGPGYYENLKEIIFFVNCDLPKSKKELKIQQSLEKNGIKIKFFKDYRKYIYGNEKLRNLFFEDNLESDLFDFFKFNYSSLSRHDIMIREVLKNCSKEEKKEKIKNTLTFGLHGTNPNINFSDLIVTDKFFKINKENEIFSFLLPNDIYKEHKNSNFLKVNNIKPFSFEKIFRYYFISVFYRINNLSEPRNKIMNYIPSETIEMKEYLLADIEKIGYKNNILAIKYRFGNQATYHYFGITEKIFQNMINSKDISNYFFENINFRYDFAMLPPEWATKVGKKGNEYFFLGKPYFK